MNKLKKIYNNLLEILFPTNVKCALCNIEIATSVADKYLCDDCFKNLPLITGKTCLKCGEPLYSQAKYCLRCKNSTFNFSCAYSYGAYDGSLKQLIHNFKFNNKPYLDKCLAHMLVITYIMKIAHKHKIDAVTYVPIHKSRLKQRGYNQCELLSQEFCKQTNLPLMKNLIIKTKNTKAQASLSLTDRKTNLNNAFELTNKEIVNGKNFLLIDDIFTTGSSCEECSILLKKNGANKIIVLTVAHTILNNASIKEK